MEGMPLGDLTKNFSRSEFKCKCGKCDANYVDIRLVKGVQEMRDNIGKPIIINCATRCPEHNKEVGGVRDSQHIKGRAADIRVVGMSPAQLAKEAEKVEVFRNGGIGTYNTFVHVDVRGHKARWNG